MYSSANSNHFYRISKIDNEYILYEDDVEMCRGSYSGYSQWNDHAVKLELLAHGSGSSSGVYYDELVLEITTK